MGCLCAKSSGVYFQESYFTNKLAKSMSDTMDLLNCALDRQRPALLVDVDTTARNTVSREVTIKLFLQFCSMDDDESGELSLKELYSSLNIKRSRFMDTVFTVLDKDESGELDFTEFLVGLWNFLTFDEDAIIKLCFDIYDIDGNGTLTIPELESLLRMLHASDRKAAKLKKHLAAADTNDDGLFTREELKELNRNHPTLLAPALDTQDGLRQALLGRTFWKAMAKWRNETYGPLETVESIIERHERQRRETAEQKAERERLAADRAIADRKSKAKLEAEARRKEEDARWDSMLPEEQQEITYRRQVWHLRSICDEEHRRLGLTPKINLGRGKAGAAAAMALAWESGPEPEEVLGYTHLMKNIRNLELELDKLLPQMELSFHKRLEAQLGETRRRVGEEVDVYLASKGGRAFVKRQVVDKKKSGMSYAPRQLTQQYCAQEYKDMKLDAALQEVSTSMTEVYESEAAEFREMREDLLLDYGVDDTSVDWDVWERKWSEEYQRYYFFCAASGKAIWSIPAPGEEDPDYETLKGMRKWGVVDDIYAKRAKNGMVWESESEAASRAASEAATSSSEDEMSDDTSVRDLRSMGKAKRNRKRSKKGRKSARRESKSTSATHEGASSAGGSTIGDGPATLDVTVDDAETMHVDKSSVGAAAAATGGDQKGSTDDVQTTSNSTNLCTDRRVLPGTPLSR